MSNNMIFCVTKNKLLVQECYTSLTINSKSYTERCPSSSILSNNRPLSRVLWHGWDNDQGLSTILFNHYLVCVIIDHLLSWEKKGKMS